MSHKPPCFDEMFDADGAVRPAYAGYRTGCTGRMLRRWRKGIEAEGFFRRTGITFNVYGDDAGEERLTPFDMIPRIVTAREWRKLTKGIEQRLGAQRVPPRYLSPAGDCPRRPGAAAADCRERGVLAADGWPRAAGRGLYAYCRDHLVRTGPDEFMACWRRRPHPQRRFLYAGKPRDDDGTFPELFTKVNVRPVSDYPRRLAQSLAACAPACAGERPTVAVLTPGISQFGLFRTCLSGRSDWAPNWLRAATCASSMAGSRCGPRGGSNRFDALYRRVDDEYLDPLSFVASTLGVPGIMDIYRAGGITIANAPGTGIADDKAIYSFMPEIVEFYTGERPILSNVPTWRCSEKDSLAYVLDNLADLVVKEVHGSGGYGMLIGPTSSRKELADFAAKLRAKPANYIRSADAVAFDCADLHQRRPRPAPCRSAPIRAGIAAGIDITPAGLTRVALKKGNWWSISQGGGTKDSWVLEE